MNTLRSYPTRGLTLMAFAALAACSSPPPADESDAGQGGAGTAAASPEQTEEGFRSLLDGGSLEAWRGYRKDAVPGGWTLEDGTLAFDPAGGGGDLITRDQFASFELRLDWRVGEGGNSGIMFHVTEDHTWPYESGPEYQVLDNARHADGRSPLTSAGSNYALNGPPEDVSRPAGEWNEARLVVDGATVEHWLNGVKVVSYQLWTPEWEEAVAASKFAAMPDYGRARTGHIALQDHGDPVWFRNIRIREIGGGR